MSRLGLDTMTPLKPPPDNRDSPHHASLKDDQCYICEKDSVDKMNNHLDLYSFVYRETCDKLFKDRNHEAKCSNKICLVCGDVASKTKLGGTTSCQACFVSSFTGDFVNTITNFLNSRNSSSTSEPPIETTIA